MNRLAATDTETLAALFDINMEGETDFAAVAKSAHDAICRKCKGSGKFIGYTGKVVGPCFTCKGAGVHDVKPAGQDGSAEINVAKISEAFAVARSNKVKSPKLRLAGFMFSRAPDTGKNPGAIYVKAGEQYLGKVLGDKFFPVRECTAEHKASVIAVAADPAASAKAYGFRTGSCSCCGRELTNGVSVELGIGPICAEKYGW